MATKKKRRESNNKKASKPKRKVAGTKKTSAKKAKTVTAKKNKKPAAKKVKQGATKKPAAKKIKKTATKKMKNAVVKKPGAKKTKQGKRVIKKPLPKKVVAKKPVSKKITPPAPAGKKTTEKKVVPSAPKKPAPVAAVKTPPVLHDEKKKLVEKKPVEKKLRPLTQDKIDMLRQAIITILWRKENIPAEMLRQEAVGEISFSLDDEFPRYFDHVIEMLTRYNLIEEVPDKRPPHIRLSQKLDV